jgi:hypothetical protein
MTIGALTGNPVLVVPQDLLGSPHIVVGQGSTFATYRQQLAASAWARGPVWSSLQTFAESVHDGLIQALAGPIRKKVGQRVGLRVIDG